MWKRRQRRIRLCLQQAQIGMSGPLIGGTNIPVSLFETPKPNSLQDRENDYKAVGSQPNPHKPAVIATDVGQMPKPVMNGILSYLAIPVNPRGTLCRGEGGSPEARIRFRAGHYGPVLENPCLSPALKFMPVPEWARSSADHRILAPRRHSGLPPARCR